MSIGADPNSRDIEGWTPLHAAVKWGNEDICRELIANGADLECLNNNNETPIKLADNHMKSVLEELAVKYRVFLVNSFKINNMTRKKSPQYVNKTSARVTKSGKPPLGILKIKQDKKKQETPTDKLQTAYSIPRPSQRAYSVTPVVAVAEIPESIPSKQTTSPEPLVDEVSRPIRPPDIKISIPSSNNKDSRLEESSEKIQNLQQEIITLRKERESLLKIIDNLRSQLKSVENPSSKPESNIRLGITSIARPPIRK
ncbi:hypothetical protein HZS_6062 [Henneguya salminicola]|nr:hypothetical protein HZS_6062 [Henneguya salminicola]